MDMTRQPSTAGRAQGEGLRKINFSDRPGMPSRRPHLYAFALS